ncbi:FMN-dependent NADH-azoreductase [Pseudonocardia kunmingensis]|uniref:FMN dependent NADH:quinone oxidoreductase n=1 Tax=Pseudonocardia kunmingensis TaxID=630975 RepID=A0A543D0W3_9PSEU|nr:NAD(P)H-dependent oxidoreductase [Pseudonocardia kunmingensis]TQM02962.1 FMN-dependent NADH-azoreductase [Pseudonocardia kunmingensis]
MTLFRVDASIRVEGSVSRELADTVERTWIEHHPHDRVLRRDLAADPLPADAWQLAATAGFTAEEDRTPAQRDAVALAARLADEVLAADALVVASPLYNFGVSQHLKTWTDLLIADQRCGPGRLPLQGKPVTVVVARGGGYSPGTPRDGWDHATPYVERIFGDVLGGDVAVVTAELTLADVNPHMADLRDLAAASRSSARELAESTARAHARLVALARTGAA